jgi:hypothetical protein
MCFLFVFFVFFVFFVNFVVPTTIIGTCHLRRCIFIPIS